MIFISKLYCVLSTQFEFLIWPNQNRQKGRDSYFNCFGVAGKAAKVTGTYVVMPCASSVVK